LNKKILKQCKLIKIVLTDVDGVLTDGGMYYSPSGDIMKKFHTRDGMGINLLLRNNIKTVIITKEKSIIVKNWAKEMNVFEVRMGVKRKELELSKICNKFHLTKNEIAYIGDDVNDIDLMKKVGLSSTPKDGIEQAKQIVDYICKSKGGEGAFREFADLILAKKFPQMKKWY